MRKAIFSILLAPVLLCSCGSIVNGSCQTVGIQSTPTDANVYIDQCYVGKTPMKARLTRKDNHIVKVDLAGYEPYEIYYDRHVSGWFYGNIAFGGLLGIAIDAVSGGMYKLTPRQAQVAMRQDHLAQVKGDKDFVAIVLKADPEWEKIGQLRPIADNQVPAHPAGA